MDNYIFGSCSAALYLTSLLRHPDFKKYSRSISRYICHNEEILNKIRSIKDEKLIYFILDMYRNKIKNQKHPWPEVLVTNVKNILITNINYLIDAEKSLAIKRK